MAENQTLTLWTKLLVAEYGRRRVITALAQAEDADLETIEQEVEALGQRKTVKRRRQPKTLKELLEELKLEPEARSLVNEIGCAYQNKRYLGELWRVRRFLESNGVDADKLRSRTAALPVVIGVLGEIPLNELREIASEVKEPSRGDLAILADQILGTDGADKSPVHEQRVDSAKESPP